MRFFLALLCLVSTAAPLFAHGDNSHFPQTQDITVKTANVAGNVYMLQGRGGNIGALVGTDGILLVDDDYKNVSEKLAAALKELGSASPRYIFNTHWHGDHTEGNEFFGKNSTIVAHTNVRKRLSQDNTVFGRTVPAAPMVSWPVITYTESMSVYINGEEVRAVHYPNSHTDGDTVMFFKGSNVVHLGDMFFVGRFPFVDLASGGSVQGLMANIATLLQTIPADAKIIPGHGPVAGLAELKTYHTTLGETVKIVEDAMKAGKTLDEIKKAGLPEKYAAWGSGFIKTDVWLETVYNSLGRK